MPRSRDDYDRPPARRRSFVGQHPRLVGCGTLSAVLFSLFTVCCGVGAVLNLIDDRKAGERIARADAAWDAGDRAGAAGDYREVVFSSGLALSRTPPAARSRVYERLIQHEAGGDNADATADLADRAEREGVDLSGLPDAAKQKIDSVRRRRLADAERKAEADRQEAAEKAERERVAKAERDEKDRLERERLAAEAKRKAEELAALPAHRVVKKHDISSRRGLDIRLDGPITESQLNAIGVVFRDEAFAAGFDDVIIHYWLLEDVVGVDSAWGISNYRKGSRPVVAILGRKR